MLTAYQTGINARLKYSDSASMLAAYRAALLNKQNSISLPAQNGSVLFANLAGIGYDSLNFYYNNISYRLAIGSITTGSSLILPMISNNSSSPTSSQVVSSSSILASYTDAWYAFNGSSNSSGWGSAVSPSSPQYIQINMGTITPINSYKR